ncbi:hypothetical protein [Pseudomonas sp. Irchel 3E19]|uniref:hypothetical protein n=1 Tax=Pseudomonas sp. Irchel 3E19 TaxID=2008981 RepID=UPI000BA2C3A0|nr:hypothetical protein [Pseudomonas sp. Irchel 3E19]
MTADITTSETATTDPFAIFKFQARRFAHSIFSENTRKAYYAISISAGLGIFFLYFSHINYTPRISLTDSIMLIFSALIIGIIFSLTMAGLFIFPSFIWRDLVEDFGEDQSLRFKYILHRQGIALFLLIVLFLCVLLFESIREYSLIFIICILLLWPISMFANNEKLKKHATALAINALIMSVCTYTLVTLVLHGVEDIPDSSFKEPTTRIIVFASFTFVLFANIFIASLKRANATNTLLIAFSLLTAILIATQSTAAIPKGIMRTLGLGSFQANEIVLTDELCDYFRSIDQSKIKRINKKSCLLINPWILWKGEDATLIRIKNTKYQIEKKYINIMSYDVYGTSTPEQKKP